jgi:hypothetical protein
VSTVPPGAGDGQPPELPSRSPPQWYRDIEQLRDTLEQATGVADDVARERAEQDEVARQSAVQDEVARQAAEVQQAMAEAADQRTAVEDIVRHTATHIPPRSASAPPSAPHAEPPVAASGPVSPVDPAKTRPGPLPAFVTREDFIRALDAAIEAVLADRLKPTRLNIAAKLRSPLVPDAQGFSDSSLRRWCTTFKVTLRDHIAAAVARRSAG